MLKKRTPSNQPPNFIGLIGLKIHINSTCEGQKNITAEIQETKQKMKEKINQSKSSLYEKKIQHDKLVPRLREREDQKLKSCIVVH